MKRVSEFQMAGSVWLVRLLVVTGDFIVIYWIHIQELAGKRKKGSDNVSLLQGPRVDQSSQDRSGVELNRWKSPCHFLAQKSQGGL